MGKKAKKFLVVLVALVMVFAVSISLIACKDDEKEKPKKFDNTKSLQYANEIADILANTLVGSDLSNGFALDLDVTVGKTKISIAGNVLNKGPEDGDANNDFRIEAREGDKLVFGMYNSGENLGITAGGQNFHFKDASIMKVLRMALVQYVDGYEEFGSLANIDLMGAPLSDVLRSSLGPILLSLCKTGPIVETTQASDIKLVDGKYVFKIQGDAIKKFLQEPAIVNAIKIDTSFIPDGTVIECTLEKNSTGGMKSLAVKVNDTNVGVITNDKLFLPVNEEFDAKMPEAISDIEATNILTAKVESSIQFVAVNDSVIRDMTFELNVDMNPLLLLDGELNAETIKKIGYFTMDIKADVSAETGVPGQMQSLFGIGFHPEKTGTDSVYLYLQVSSDNKSLTTGDKNMVMATEFNISTLLDALLFKKPSATFKPGDYTPKDEGTKMASQFADGGLVDMSVITTILDLLGMVVPEIGDLSDEDMGYIKDMVASITPQREEATKTSGLDIDVQKLLSAVGKLAGNETLFTEPIDLGFIKISISNLIFGAGLDPNVLTDIKTIKMRTEDGKATFNKAIDVPEFNPNAWLNEHVKTSINGGAGYLRNNTIETKYESSPMKVDYNTPLKEYLHSSINVKFTGFDDVVYDFTRTNEKGEIVDRTLQILDVIGFDPTKVGKQDILLHTGMVYGNLQSLISLAGPSIPGLTVDLNNFVSFIPVKLTVEVLPQAKAEDVVLEYNDETSGKMTYQLNSNEGKLFNENYPTLKVGGNSYNLMENKWLFKSVPAEYKIDADTIAGIGEYKFIIGFADELNEAGEVIKKGVEKEFIVQTWDISQAKELPAETDLFASDENKFTYFENGVSKDIILTSDNFVKANIGEEEIALSEDGKLLVGEAYLGQTITVDFKINAYDKELTFSMTYSIITTETIANVTVKEDVSVAVYNPLSGSITSESLFSLTVYDEGKIIKNGLTLRNYAVLGIGNKDFTDFSFGFSSGINAAFDNDISVTLSVWDASKENDLTDDVLKNGAITKAGVYSIKLVGSVSGLSVNNVPLTFDGEEEIWINNYVVTEPGTGVISASQFNNSFEGQNLNGKYVSFFGFPIQEYPLVQSSNRINLDRMYWDDVRSSYVLKGDLQSQSGFMSDELNAKIVSVVKEQGVPVVIEYKNDEGEWVDFTNADGFIQYSGTIDAGDLRYTINWGGGDTGFGAITYLQYNTESITIINGKIDLPVGADLNLYVNEKIAFDWITFENGVEKRTPVDSSNISSKSTAFNSEGYPKLTEAGQHTVTVTNNGITQDFTFNVEEPSGLSIPKDGASFSIYTTMEMIGSFPNIKFEIKPIVSGTSIWKLLAESGQFVNISVDENGNVVGGVLAEDQLKEVGITINYAEATVQDWTGGIFDPKITPFLNEDLTLNMDLINTMAPVGEGSDIKYISLAIQFNDQKYTYKISIDIKQ